MKGLITRQFLFDFLDGKTTSIQRKLIEEWIKEASNEEMFYSCVDEWERRHPQFAPNRQLAQHAFEQLLEGEEVPANARKDISDRPVRSVSPLLKTTSFWMVAAVGLILLSTFVFRESVFYKTYTSPADQTTCFLLKDSSEVQLFANSTLMVPRFGFGREAREVYLQGEAGFKITHQKNHSRFRVIMGDGYLIEVLGTEFTAFSGEEGKRVFLSKGKVKLELPQGKELYMRPGSQFKATVEGAYNITVPKVAPPPMYDPGQTFYFDNTPLTEVVQQIENRFGVQVKIVDKNLLYTSIGGIYKVKEAEELLTLLAALLELEITQKSNCIELRETKHNDL
ncbi:ferric-dicitrate binding protein FerR (iron transport regulator) [Dyadobacter jejuensis]|uniref:Ferric-dicitrate binding protein FerR (Iron transport regulator) n=1 Tax=Dyadobacter jejuensis TaxID=1082580 RepID=A0A316APB6_9BACT|nr:FecR domain-containing protein [Dyadobacter jejuensis]PWJ58650.1 ferric-dicitrate binding protein FerR (iron transport regulator) [Dyadobacter jejuensis]